MRHDCSTHNRERARMPLTSYTNYIPVICHICSLISLHFRQEAMSKDTTAAGKRGGLTVRKGAVCESSPGASSPPPRDDAP